MTNAAIEWLAREVLGSFDAFEHGVREAIGNTNYVLIRDLAKLVEKQSSKCSCALDAAFSGANPQTAIVNDALRKLAESATPPCARCDDPAHYSHMPHAAICPAVK